MNVLELDGVNLSFNERMILSSVYLKCQTGEIVGLIGRNGSGKSCMMNMIFGTLQGDNKSVRFNNKYYEQLFRIPGAIHYSNQDGFLMEYLSFKDLINIFDLKPKLELIYGIEEIRDNANTKLRYLSSGLKKLFELISVLYSQSSFALLDEPFSYLSPVLVEKVIPHIKSQSKSKGIILTDHQYETLFDVCDRYYMLSDGVLYEINRISDLYDFDYIAPKKENRVD